MKYKWLEAAEILAKTNKEEISYEKMYGLNSEYVRLMQILYGYHLKKYVFLSSRLFYDHLGLD